MNKIKQRITDLRCEITAITTQREPLDIVQQIELYSLKKVLRELEVLVSDENEYPIEGYSPSDTESIPNESYAFTPVYCVVCNTHKSHRIINEKQGMCEDCGAFNWRYKK